MAGACCDRLYRRAWFFCRRPACGCRSQRAFWLTGQGFIAVRAGKKNAAVAASRVPTTQAIGSIRGRRNSVGRFTAADRLSATMTQQTRPHGLLSVYAIHAPSPSVSRLIAPATSQCHSSLHACMSFPLESVLAHYYGRESISIFILHVRPRPRQLLYRRIAPNRRFLAFCFGAQ